MFSQPHATAYAYTVGQLLTYLRELFETDGFLADLWVSGEIVNFSRSPSGHVYFGLRDQLGSLRCVMFARQAGMSRYRPDNGHRVLAHGRIALYEQRGDLQLLVDFVRPEGVGIEQARWDQLVAKLEEEGLLDPARKRPLPRFPLRIGVVTSPHGAALHDICRVLERRWPLAEVVVAETPVQGDAALSGVPEAIARLNTVADIDVVIVARGGGAAEDLSVFNDEVVARAIHGSAAPVVSAIGHERDTTIADMVADLRAPTPSAAAELVAPDYRDVQATIERYGLAFLTDASERMARTHAHLEMDAQRLDRALPDVAGWLAALDLRERAVQRAVRAQLTETAARAESMRARLAALSPLATLERGYAIVRGEKDGRIIAHPDSAPVGTALDIRVAEGSIRAEVTP